MQPVGAVRLHRRARGVIEGVERRPLAVLLEEDAGRGELASGRPERDLERCGRAHELLRLADLNRGQGRATGDDVGAARGEKQEQDETQEIAHVVMVPERELGEIGEFDPSPGVRREWRRLAPWVPRSRPPALPLRCLGKRPLRRDEWTRAGRGCGAVGPAA